MEYRGVKIEPIDSIQVGYKTNRGTLARAGIGTSRKASGYIIHWPDGGKSGMLDTLKETKRRIDAYLD